MCDCRYGDAARRLARLLRAGRPDCRPMAAWRWKKRAAGARNRAGPMRRTRRSVSHRLVTRLTHKHASPHCAPQPRLRPCHVAPQRQLCACVGRPRPGVLLLLLARRAPSAAGRFRYVNRRARCTRGRGDGAGRRARVAFVLRDDANEAFPLLLALHCLARPVSGSAAAPERVALPPRRFAFRLACPSRLVPPLCRRVVAPLPRACLAVLLL